MRLYRTARPASHRRHLAKTLGWMTVVWFLALVALPVLTRGVELLSGIPRLPLPGGTLLGAGILLVASLFGIRCAFAMARGEGTPVPFDAAARLVVTGPYRYVRNPMAVSGIAQTVGVAMLGRVCQVSTRPLAALAAPHCVLLGADPNPGSTPSSALRCIHQDADGLEMDLADTP